MTFWKEYIKPEFYYLSFFEKTGQLALVEETKLHVEDSRQLFFEDITKLIQSFKNKLQIEGYLEGSDKKEREKRSIELTYAYVIQFILYKTLVDNDFDDFGKEFEFIVKKLHEYLKSNRYKDILGIIEGISAKISQNIYRPFTKEQEFIKNKIQELYHSVENKLSDVSPWLDIFVFIKKYNFANVRNEIFGYIYENYLKELYEESKKGQYFTDPAVVNFMLDQVGYTPEVLTKRYAYDKDSISIIDPSCGSGTFLYSATDSIVKAFRNGTKETSKKIEEAVTNCVFGLDIEEFPLYLAEMNILMRMLPLIINEKYNNPIDKKIKVFKTRDSISEFMDTALRNTFSDQTIEFQKKAISPGQTQLFTEKLNLGYSSYVRDESDLEEMKKSLENQPEIPRRRFDYVIGNPPYVSYNECSKQKVLIFELMKQGKAKLNDIYGINLHSVPEHQKKYAPKPNLYTFFIALGIALLKDNGRLCYIIPQTILTAGDLDVLRYHLSKFTTIEKIITFSGKIFVGRGLKQDKPVATSSLIFVLSREMPSSSHQVEIINYETPDDEIEKTLQNISIGKKIRKRRILQTTLYQNITNWNFIKQNKIFLDFYEEYKKNTESISIYYNHSWAQNQFKSKFYFDIGFILDPKNIVKSNNSGELYELLDFKTFYNYSLFIPNAYYPKDKNKIELTQNSQGYITLEQQYKILWSIKNPDKYYFTDRKIIFYMGKASIICSNNKREILYLFSLLNSPVTNLVLKSQLKAEQEKEYLIPIKAVKEFVRVPIINESNKALKDKIIEQTEDLLSIEKLSLSDLIDFSGVLKQKFDKVSIEGNKLILKKDGEKIELPVKRNISLVNKVLETNFGEDSLGLDRNIITLSELISLPVIDFEKQTKIKDFINDLVFCLYFNINIPKNKLSNVKFVRSQCLKNKFYKQISIS